MNVFDMLVLIMQKIFLFLEGMSSGINDCCNGVSMKRLRVRMMNAPRFRLSMQALASLFFLVATVSMSPILESESLAAQENTVFKNLSLDCRKTTFSECVDKLAEKAKVTVSYNEKLKSRPIDTSLENILPLDALRQLLDAVAAGNFSLFLDQPAKRVVVNLIDLPTKKLSDSQPKSEVDGQKTPPSAKQLSPGNTVPEIEAMVAPGLTLRQFSDLIEKASVLTPNPNNRIISNPSEKGITWKEFQQHTAAAEQASKEAPVLPDGMIPQEVLQRVSALKIDNPPVLPAGMPSREALQKTAPESSAGKN